jgi:hypothetical protein
MSDDYGQTLENRLYNWKFRKACAFLEGESEEVKDTVRILSDLFGDCGWPDPITERIEEGWGQISWTNKNLTQLIRIIVALLQETRNH